jgi:hypothetical protein
VKNYFRGVPNHKNVKKEEKNKEIYPLFLSSGVRVPVGVLTNNPV